MVEMQVDPMEPPKFNTSKKIPRGPPSPPVPVLHSPTRKLTAKEQQDWKIPPCVSNWKNAKGYTIPLDKRLAADGRGLQVSDIPSLNQFCRPIYSSFCVSSLLPSMKTSLASPKRFLLPIARLAKRLK